MISNKDYIKIDFHRIQNLSEMKKKTPIKLKLVSLDFKQF